MFLHVKGEGLNVGCILTWGPCYDFQRQFFDPTADKLSEPLTVLKYDVEVSGFGSQALGHVCLLNLQGPDLPRLGRHGDQGLADLDHARSCVGQAAGGRRPATPTRPAAWRSPRLPRRRAASRPARRRQGRQRSARRKPQKDCCPRTSPRIDTDKDGVLTEAELIASLDSGDGAAAEPGHPGD